MSRIYFGLSLALISSPALARPVPGPEIGAGIPTLGLLAVAALVLGAVVLFKRRYR